MAFMTVRTEEDLHFQFSVERLMNSRQGGGVCISAFVTTPPHRESEAMWGLDNPPGPDRVPTTQ